MTIYSQAFSEGGEIPVDYTCDGQGKSPALTFGNVPDGSKSLTLILEDPDAPQGTFTHWLVFNIPPDTVTVDEELPTTTPTFGLPGRNSAGSESYVGPCPPNGQHRYYFTLYALDTTLPLEAGTTKEQVMAAMVGHVIAETRLMGCYGAERRKI
ncbi:MAG: YbhB/YbcL family Raf kinase inhibitor-like protein [Patescibacteria group bacterium]|nr:YbhB/YbcL family Raf kinase inhibitor-like protein [Patescibacteria group bacterium]